MSPVLSRLAERTLIGIAGSAGDREPDLMVLRVSSLVEVYVDDLLDSLAARHLAGESDFAISVSELVTAQLHQNWPQRRLWLRQSFGVSLDGTVEDQDFSLLVELRNAIAHGGGRLTFLQRKTLAAQLTMQDRFTRRLGVHCDGVHVACTEATSSLAIRVASDYVRSLDAQAAPHLLA